MQGWKGCAPYCVPTASFSAQAEPLAQLKTIEEYAEWMAGLANTTMPGCTYEVKHASWDATRRTAAFFAVFKGQHTGPGPCPPTGKSTASDYVYVMHVDAAGKIDSMTKVRVRLCGLDYVRTCAPCST